MSNQWAGIARQLLSQADLNSLLRPDARSHGAEYLGMFGFGLVVGAALGALLAPRSGRELREKLGERVHEMRDRLEGGSQPPAPH